MSTYRYPYEEFERDFIKVSSERREEGKDAVIRMIVYLADTYPDKLDRQKRGAVIGKVGSFIADHAEEFDTGRIAVVGPDTSLVSMDFLRAAFELISPLAFGEAGHPPTVTEVLALAEQYAATD